MQLAYSKRRLELHYILIQVFFWCMMTAITTYQVVILTQRGFSNTEIGTIISIRSISAIVFPPLLSGWVDKHRTIPLKYIVSVCLGISLIAAAVYAYLPIGFVGTLLVFVILGWLEISSLPFVDMMAVDCMNQGYDIRYGFARGIGSLGYALVGFFLGIQIDVMGAEATLTTHLMLVILTMVAVLTFPTIEPVLTATKNHYGTTDTSNIISMLFKSPYLLLMLLAIMFGMTGLATIGTFLPTIVESRTASATMLGFVILWGGLWEVPAAMLSNYIMKKTSSSVALLLSFFCFTMRVVFLLLVPGVAGLLLAQTTNMGYGLYNPAVVHYVKDNVSSTEQAKGQTLMMVFGGGFAGIMGSMIPGYLLDIAGLQVMMLFGLASCLVGCALGFVSIQVRAKSQ